jgi:DNA or RNA helicases of superfamily II
MSIERRLEGQVMAYKESDLVLEVSKSVNPDLWDEGFYQNFLDLIFGERVYQKEATEVALRYMNSGEYSKLEDLAKENFGKNQVIQERFSGNFDSMKNDLDLSQKVAGTLDLATGTGKSYVMIALALIMLASKKVTRVLVLVPSLTIEQELTSKFKEAVSNEQWIKSLGENFIAPEILNGDSTLVENSIAIENRNAIYRAQANRNSIVDSLKNNGESTLVLNDEVHHVYYSESNQWKNFITDTDNNGIDFKYVIGLTGTAYKRHTSTGEPNDYFSDVIYRYSLRDAIENNYVKDIEYISKEDMPSDKGERWQVILNSHDRISTSLSTKTGEKPITLIVTANQTKADSQAKMFKQFLKQQRNLSDDQADKIVLSVHSGDKAAADRVKLKSVDQPGNPVEFIFSVSMLTEGWDVKRVFQIVPDEERAFNSKLLIAQVLGRGLRRPVEWRSEWGIPTVTVFNHEKWSANVKSLVDEILEIRKTLTVTTDKNSPYNFELVNVEYKTEAKTTDVLKLGTYNLWIKTNSNYEPVEGPDGKDVIVGVKLPTDKVTSTTNLAMSKIGSSSTRELELEYKHDLISVDEMAQILFTRFDDLDDPESTANYKRMWPVDKIKQMIEISLKNSGNSHITKKIKESFLSSMNVIFRQNTKSVTYDVAPDVFVAKNTANLHRETIDLNTLKNQRTIFYTDQFEKSLDDDASKASYNELADTSNGYKHVMVTNRFNFKTPQDAIITSGQPETDFIKKLIQPEIASAIDAFIKSSDMNFYDFEYVWQKGSHHKTGKFNPDWFIKQGNTIIIVETKDDSQIADPDTENIGKNKAAISHFEILNQHFSKEGIDLSYKFAFLTPKDYDVFFEKILNRGTEEFNFNSQLDVSLSDKV